MVRQKTALVMGAARGIGGQVVISITKAGYGIVVNYRSDREAAEEACQVVKAYGRRTEAVYVDMGVLENIRRMCEKASDIFGVVDVVVSNAGISSEVYLLDATEEDLDRMTTVNWKGAYFGGQIAAKRMIEKEVKGMIINISSNQMMGCWPRATIYAPTKAVVSEFTRNAAMELALKRIRMVDMAPSYTDIGWKPGDIRLEAAKKLPLRRSTTTEEIAQGVLYLASDAADYITGGTLIIDGATTLPVVTTNGFT